MPVTRNPRADPDVQVSRTLCAQTHKIKRRTCRGNLNPGKLSYANYKTHFLGDITIVCPTLRGQVLAGNDSWVTALLAFDGWRYETNLAKAGLEKDTEVFGQNDVGVQDNDTPGDFPLPCYLAQDILPAPREDGLLGLVM